MKIAIVRTSGAEISPQEPATVIYRDIKTLKQLWDLTAEFAPFPRRFQEIVLTDCWYEYGSPEHITHHEPTIEIYDSWRE